MPFFRGYRQTNVLKIKIVLNKLILLGIDLFSFYIHAILYHKVLDLAANEV